MPFPVDPIEQLVEALERGGKPSLAWIVRWSNGGKDPVGAAWQHSRSPTHLVRVLEIVRHPALREARGILVASFISDVTDRDRVRSDAIRRLIPTPPTLEQLLAAYAGGLAFLGITTARPGRAA